MFSTSIPFGYSLIMIFLFMVFVAAVGLAINGFVCHLKRRFLLGSVGAMMVVGLITFDLLLDSWLELNPLIASDTVIIGTWSNADEKIELHIDHHFRYTRHGKTIEGTWQRDDWNLRIIPSWHLMRFIQFRGEYRLLTHPPQDFDAWDHDFGLEKVSK